VPCRKDLAIQESARPRSALAPYRNCVSNTLRGVRALGVLLGCLGLRTVTGAELGAPGDPALWYAVPPRIPSVHLNFFWSSRFPIAWRQGRSSSPWPIGIHGSVPVRSRYSVRRRTAHCSPVPSRP
jgi:hypothetical protein